MSFEPFIQNRRGFLSTLAKGIGVLASPDAVTNVARAAGGSIPDKFQTTGSGSPFVYGVLEDRFKENMSIAEGKELGVRALTAAMKRDSASGDGISMCVIDSKGFQKVSNEEIKKLETNLAD